VLDGLQADAPAIFGLPTDAAASAWQQRLAAYWAARHQHLRNGMAVQPAANLQAMLAQVRAPLLATLRTSPDFRPAYDPLLRMAMALHRDDPAAARRLLADLQAAAPQRSEAGDALARLTPLKEGLQLRRHRRRATGLSAVLSSPAQLEVGALARRAITPLRCTLLGLMDRAKRVLNRLSLIEAWCGGRNLRSDLREEACLEPSRRRGGGRT
jgi:hypothetical protein